MSIDSREQAFQTAHQIVSEHFPNVVMVAEAQFTNEEGAPQFAQMLRWYGCSTTATGLMVFAADLLCRTYGDRPLPQPATAISQAPPPGSFDDEDEDDFDSSDDDDDFESDEDEEEESPSLQGQSGSQKPEPPPIHAYQEEALQRAMTILTEHFACVVVVAQGEPELSGRSERSLKTIRCAGPPTMAAGLAQFASNALRRMALE